MSGPVGFVVTVVTSGACAGLAIISAVVVGVDSLRQNGSTTDLNASFYVLVLGTLAGLLTAALATWWLLAPVGSVYRRGALSIVCAFATVLLMLICIPVHQLLGRIGLMGLVAVSGLATVVLAHRARRWASSS